MAQTAHADDSEPSTSGERRQCQDHALSCVKSENERRVFGEEASNATESKQEDVRGKRIERTRGEGNEERERERARMREREEAMERDRR